MAAPVAKPTGYIVAVVCLFIVVVILGTMYYLAVKDFRELSTKAEGETKKLQALQTDLKQRDDEFADLKRLTGNAPETPYGLGEDNALGKVRGNVKATLNDAVKKVGALSDESTRAAIQSLIQKTTDLTGERDKLRTDLDARQRDILALQGQYQVKVDASDKGRGDAEKDLQDLIKVKDEEVRRRETQLKELRAVRLDLEKQLGDEKAAHELKVKKLDDDIVRLTNINDKLAAQIDTITKTSFEVPKGEIRWVDNQNKLVWINLGEVDILPKKMTFSVYTKAHNGVARGKDDIKGTIEVTRIVGPHTAEARITYDELFDPIAIGDPIFTPVWSPGQKQNFSFVGLIDLDGDGKSDRQQLYESIASAGGAVDNEINDKGVRIRYTKFPSEFVEHDENTPGIDVNTKFLIVCKIPDATTAATDADREIIFKIVAKQKELKAEAAKQGVRVVTLNDFLSWSGHRPQRRLFEPGNERGFQIKAGQREPPFSKFGQVSDSISGNKRLKPQSSSGQTSGAYGSKKP